jgi:hypothetical protein
MLILSEQKKFFYSQGKRLITSNLWTIFFFISASKRRLIAGMTFRWEFMAGLSQDKEGRGHKVQTVRGIWGQSILNLFIF